ncbi:hypothetical protein NVP1081O_273 [Vibrio phage 1.081.O._10N.286.52.C2]|nr:hypothetical protein NVP1081O_273 [Vibrio phage 1.081.O._10N.286.52.C2]
MIELVIDMIRLRINELPFTKQLDYDMQVKVWDYLFSLDEKTLCTFEKHSETPEGARKILNFLKKKLGE